MTEHPKLEAQLSFGGRNVDINVYIRRPEIIKATMPWNDKLEHESTIMLKAFGEILDKMQVIPEELQLVVTYLLLQWHKECREYILTIADTLKKMLEGPKLYERGDEG